MNTIINRNDDEIIKEMFIRVLAPFALVVKHLPPIYNGMPVECLGASGDATKSVVFSINNDNLAMVDFEAETVSAFGSKFVPISEEDILAIKFILKKMEERSKKTNSIEEILKAFSQNMNQNYA